MKWSALEVELEQLHQRQLLRRTVPVSQRLRGRIRIGRRLLSDFSSNDYLGLSTDAAVRTAVVKAVRRWGAGSGASRLISGSLDLHEELESAIARFKGEESARVFSSGYMAAIGAVTALADAQDLVLVDRLDHASLIDAARLSKAKLWVYPHCDADRLGELLAKASGLFRRRLVLTDAYFSMDGSVAPLDRLLETCERHGALLMVDEAHSTGVYGPRGRGLTEHFKLMGRIPVVMGTLSKALGSSGGFIAGKRQLIDTLTNKARTFIYTTAMTPASSAAALAALRCIESEPYLRQRLWDNTGRLRRSLELMGWELGRSEGPVIPVMIGSSAKAVKLSSLLFKQGVFAPAIRPPTVPKGTDRIRLSVSAAHTRSDIEKAERAFRRARMTLS